MLSRIKKNQRGFSEALASIILAAVVLTIGGTVWAFTHSATTVMANSYYREVNESMNRVKERFTIENIYFENSTQMKLKIWVYNYGQVDINVDVYVEGEGSILGLNQSLTPVSAGELVRIDVVATNITEDMDIGIKVTSFRGNSIYEKIQIP